MKRQEDIDECYKKYEEKISKNEPAIKIKEIICDFELGFNVSYNISVTSNLDNVIIFWDLHGTSAETFPGAFGQVGAEVKNSCPLKLLGKI